MSSTIQDLRYAVRTLAQRPGFTLVVVLTLGLGTGAGTTVVELLNLVAWQRPPVSRPGELFRVLMASEPSMPRRISYLDYLDYRDASTSVTGLTAYMEDLVSLDTGEESRQVDAWAVTSNYFAVLGLDPAVGRLLVPADGDPGAPAAVVLGHALWQRLFAADPGVVGEVLLVNGRSMTVVGVAPQGFRGTLAGRRDGRPGSTRWCPCATSEPRFQSDPRLVGPGRAPCRTRTRLLSWIPICGRVSLRGD